MPVEARRCMPTVQSQHSTTDDIDDDGRIWLMDVGDGNWSDPKSLNTGVSNCRISITTRGRMYTKRQDIYGSCRARRRRLCPRKMSTITRESKKQVFMNKEVD